MDITAIDIARESALKLLLRIDDTILKIRYNAQLKSEDAHNGFIEISRY